MSRFQARPGVYMNDDERWAWAAAYGAHFVYRSITGTVEERGAVAAYEADRAIEGLREVMRVRLSESKLPTSPTTQEVARAFCSAFIEWTEKPDVALDARTIDAAWALAYHLGVKS